MNGSERKLWKRRIDSTQWKAQYGHLRSLILGYWNHETTSFSELEYMETAKLNNLDPQYDFHFKLSNYFGSYRDTFGPYSSCHKCKESMAYQMMLGSPKDLQNHTLPPKKRSLNFWKRTRRVECEMAFIGLELYDEGYNCGPTVVPESGKSFNEICTLDRRINNGRQQLHRCFHPAPPHICTPLQF